MWRVTIMHGFEVQNEYALKNKLLGISPLYGVLHSFLRDISTYVLQFRFIIHFEINYSAFNRIVLGSSPRHPILARRRRKFSSFCGYISLSWLDHSPLSIKWTRDTIFAATLQTSGKCKTTSWNKVQTLLYLILYTCLLLYIVDRAIASSAVSPIVHIQWRNGNPVLLCRSGAARSFRRWPTIARLHI